MNEEKENSTPSQLQAARSAGGQFSKGNKLGKRFPPGQSGNPGGNYRRTPKVSHAYARILAMSPEEIKAFQPTNGAEELALARYKEARDGQTLHPLLPLQATKEITDRTEGKAKAIIETRSAGDELERLIGRIQERARVQLGLDLTREEVIERVRAYRPDLVAELEGG